MIKKGGPAKNRISNWLFLNKSNIQYQVLSKSQQQIKHVHVQNIRQILRLFFFFPWALPAGDAGSVRSGQ